MVFVKRDIKDLSPLDEASEAHMRLMMDSLSELIHSNEGWIGFDQYMTHVLYEPGLGYYSAGAEKFGLHGDYITAPLISSLFSQTLAMFVGQHLPRRGSVLELGAGTGIMAADILQALAKQDRMPQVYYILELSADLRLRQQQTLQQKVPQFMDRIQWLDCLKPVDEFRGVVLANEVIDALPVKRFTIRGATVRELGVGIDAGTLCWRERSADNMFEERVLQCLPFPLEDYPDGYHSEISYQLKGWLGYLAEYLHEGIMLFIDYGMDRKTFYQTQRTAGTLRGYHRHHAIDDPFFRPGLTDITAWVDFTSLAEAAEEHHLSVSGYASQAGFLLDCGLPGIFQGRSANSELERLKLAEEVKCLTLPGEMGETVKVMALSKNCEIQSGFFQDLRYSL